MTEPCAPGGGYTIADKYGDPREMDVPVFQVEDNEVRFYHEPEDRLAAVIGLIGMARKSVRAFYYMVGQDEVGEAFMKALCKACERGVKVELVIDAVGSDETDDSFFNKFLELGGTWFKFSASFSSKALVRNHQKILVVDEEHAIVSGFNMAAAYFGKADPPENSWEDMGTLVSGPDAGQLGEYYDKLIAVSKQKKVKLRKLRKLVKEWHGDRGPLCWTIGGPGRVSPWVRALKSDLDKGQRLDMVEAYFSPGRGILKRIGQLARRGSARLILAGRTDHAITLAAHRLTHGYLLKRKADIMEYQRCRLHMKCIVIDDIVYAGSSNMDARSLFVNLEIMVRIESAEAAAHIRERMDRMEGDSLEITPQLHDERDGIFAKIYWAFAYFVVTVVDKTVSGTIGRVEG
ncbi:phospholipase D-like domain-containing protein [Novosphingopyxis sp.]|uniref:phospholipase D-like domain-containing protein n=1 Tax=Novosphingopyxis sp. TaxID=2709690 RepID=UPI003B59569B